jgi:hypothetical protein
MVRTIEPIANRHLKPICSALVYASNISSCPHFNLRRLRNRANRPGQQSRRPTYLRNQWFGILRCHLGSQSAETMHLRCRDARLSGKELAAFIDRVLHFDYPRSYFCTSPGRIKKYLAMCLRAADFLAVGLPEPRSDSLLARIVCEITWKNLEKDHILSRNFRLQL